MTLVAVTSWCVSAAARLDIRLDMVIPSLKADTPLYAENRNFVTAWPLLERYVSGMGSHKKASQVSPARFSRLPMGMRSGCAWGYDAGIRTVSITWITPFD